MRIVHGLRACTAVIVGLMVMVLLQYQRQHSRIYPLPTWIVNAKQKIHPEQCISGLCEACDVTACRNAGCTVVTTTYACGLYCTKKFLYCTSPTFAYQNSELGFSLTFPRSWEGFQTTDVTTDTYRYSAFTLGNGASEKAEFSIIRVDGDEPLLPEGATVLTKANGATFAYHDSSSPTPDEFAERKREIPEIIATFAFAGYH